MGSDDIDRVIGFWKEAGPDLWFATDQEFDARFRERFNELHMAAAQRRLDGWAETPEGSLALLILLDQFPRNCFRGSGHMYATDPLARFFARRALEAGHDRRIEPQLRPFLYLPFEHSEDLADQDMSVALSRELDDSTRDYAERHRDIIRQFGRFPHRNPLLGRTMTPEEQRYLDEGGFGG